MAFSGARAAEKTSSSGLAATEVAVAPKLRLEIKPAIQESFLKAPPRAAPRQTRDKVAAFAGVNPVVFTIVPQADGLYDVEASDGGPSSFLVSFRTRGEAEAWIRKLKGMTD
jgi:hypothetical protein